MSLITKLSFICMFFNTSLQILLFEANLKEHLPGLLGQIFKGKYTDFNAKWFEEIGSQIVETNIANLFLEPLTDFLLTKYRDYKVYRDLKGGKTKCTSMEKYLKIHGGTDFEIQEKYATIVTVVYTTMMLGPAIPILFPIAFVNFFILYFCELYMIIYMNRMPPNYDEKLNKEVLEWLRPASLVLVCFSFWFYSNK